MKARTAARPGTPCRASPATRSSRTPTSPSPSRCPSSARPRPRRSRPASKRLATQNSTRTTPNSYTTNGNFIATPATAGEPRLGRILLAKPDLTGDTLKDSIYQGWLYAAVMVHNQGDLVQFPPPIAPPSALWGVFVTKDFGQNWTRVMMPTDPFVGVPTNGFDPQNPLVFTPQIDPTGSGTPGGSYYFKGNFSSSLAVDPTNPNILYFGGTDMFGTTGMVRVDTTGIADPHAFYLSNDDPDQDPTEGQFRSYAGYDGPSSPAGAGALDETDEVGNPLTMTYSITRAPIAPPRDPAAAPRNAYDPRTSPFLNLIRDPARPFQANATILVSGVATFNNTGTKSRWIPFTDPTKPDPFLADSTDTWSRTTRGQHQILTLRDPLTGRARLIFANDNGVFTAVDEGDGTLVGSIGGVVDPSTRAGNVQIVNGSRNGNLSIDQFRSGAAQPSELSAQIGTLVGRGMFFGVGEDGGQPASDPGIITPGSAGLRQRLVGRPQRRGPRRPPDPRERLRRRHPAELGLQPRDRPARTGQRRLPLHEPRGPGRGRLPRRPLPLLHRLLPGQWSQPHLPPRPDRLRRRRA